MVTSMTVVNEQLMLRQALSATLESVINKALDLNVNSNEILSSLDDKQLTLVLDELGFPLTFVVSNKQILVTSLKGSDCHVITSINTLKQLKKSQQLTALIKQGLLDIQGDLKTAQQFIYLAENIEIDWQYELTKYIGDIATYKLSRMAKFVQDKISFAKTQISADLSEWLVHERKLLVTAGEINDFKQQVSQTASQVENQIQRLDRLFNLIKKG